MSVLFKILYIILASVFVFYVLLPNPSFPEPLPYSLQSSEPADVETSLRRGYYTDLSREEVLKYYQGQLKKSAFFNIYLPTYRLNYPPEEAQVIIRDQTRSTFLEEIVHPFRESFYINGFEPNEPQNIIEVDGKIWRQKIIVRFVPSNTFARLPIILISLVLLWIVTKQFVFAVGELLNPKFNHNEKK